MFWLHPNRFQYKSTLCLIAISVVVVVVLGFDQELCKVTHDILASPEYSVPECPTYSLAPDDALNPVS